MSKQIYIYTNEQRTAENAKSKLYLQKEESTAKPELYLQKRRKNNRKWQNKAIIILNNTNSHSNRDNTKDRRKTVSNDSYLPYFLVLQDEKYRKTTENVKKKKASFSFVFLVLRGERCENGKKKGFCSVTGGLTIKQLEKMRGR